MIRKTLYLFLIAFRIIYVDCRLSYSQGGARARFEEKFHKTCSKYSFVDKYIENMKNPSKNYMIFVFNEPGQRGQGGLGDRLAGLVTAFAYAIRMKRTLLIQGDTAFEDAFRPYYPHDMDQEQSMRYTWKNWNWAKWDRDYATNITNLRCVNPRFNAQYCALETFYNDQFKVVKYRSNRCYLCRWLIKPSLGMRPELAVSLGITLESNLYEVAGCMLRLAMWPTEKLWTALDDSLQEQFLRTHQVLDSASLADGSQVVKTSKQIGFHFRCGDTSFSANSSTPPNPQCFYDVSGKVPWNGTMFEDDKSMESPLDEAQCGVQVLKDAQTAGSGPVLAYIASDNGFSARQINSTLDWGFTIKPPNACHIDLQSNTHCTLTTSLHWFMLALSDVLVVQALIKPEDTSYVANSPETAHLIDTEAAPISAFSRYAAIYSLSPGVLRYGRGCHAVNTTALSYQTHGNWICDTKLFF